MKKIFLLATFAALTMGTQAQEGRKVSKEDRKEMRQKMTPDERADRQAERMQKRLGLSDEQASKIKEVNVKYMPEKDLATERRELRQERLELMRNRELEYQEILTREQMKEYRELKEDRMEKMKNLRAERKNARRNTTQPASR